MRILWLVLVLGCDAASESGTDATADANADGRVELDMAPSDGSIRDARPQDARPPVDANRPVDADPVVDAAPPADAEPRVDARIEEDARLGEDARPADAAPDAAQADASQPDAAPLLDAVVEPEPVPPHLADCPPQVDPDQACQNLENPRVSLMFDANLCQVFEPQCGNTERPFNGPCGCGCVARSPECCCPRIIEPVCGVDGVTRPNPCEARLAQVATAHAGPCDPAWCPPLDAVNTREAGVRVCENPELFCGVDEAFISAECGCGCLRPGATCPDLFDPGVAYRTFGIHGCVRPGEQGCAAGMFPINGRCGCGCVERSAACPPTDGRDVIYASPEPGRCQGVVLDCPPGSTPFNDSCGCGCRLPLPPGCNCPDEGQPVCGVTPQGRHYAYVNACRMACDNAVEDPGPCGMQPEGLPCPSGQGLANDQCVRLCADSDGCQRGEVCRLFEGRCLVDPACPDCAGCLGTCVNP